ncbi:predicted protein [Nematostella vectensis]|uniref:Uncharacterized protein n=1 Tax=Nematostella vectensis TaxID=45351 RepID=A7S0H9_NEMVE|nr:predicted protein [Nematostella vectensis]|eukprot:XP_001634795.1 predicted protein [Nematostella vectensis]
MAKARSSVILPKLELKGVKDQKTKKEIERQQELLAADVDRKSLRGNVTAEDWRYTKRNEELAKNEKRHKFEINTEKTALLKDLEKVRSSYTGHYDDSKSPIENIQQALKTRVMTPARSSRLAVPQSAIRRSTSQENLRTTPRGRSSHFRQHIETKYKLYLEKPSLRRPETVHSMRPFKQSSDATKPKIRDGEEKRPVNKI